MSTNSLCNIYYIKSQTNQTARDLWLCGLYFYISSFSYTHIYIYIYFFFVVRFFSVKYFFLVAVSELIKQSNGIN